MVDTLDSMIANLQTYVVSPLNAFGLAGFVFDAQGESVASLNAEITDHYTEDNRALQDHIAIRPKRIVLKGYVGEVVHGDTNPNAAFLQQLTQKLTAISGYLPILSSAATQLKDAIVAPSQSSLTLTDAANIYGAVKNLLSATGNGTKQQAAYNFFQALMNEKILMAVQTPWEFLTNMAVESIIAVQEETSDFITDFAITLKQIRIAQTLTLAYAGATSLQGAAAIQAEGSVTLGGIPGATLPTTLLTGVQSQIEDASSLSEVPGIYNSFHIQLGE